MFDLADYRRRINASHVRASIVLLAGVFFHLAAYGNGGGPVYVESGNELAAEATVLRQAGDFETSTGDFETSIWRYEKAYQAFLRQSDYLKAAEAMINIGATYTVISRYEEAITAFEAAKAALQRSGRRRSDVGMSLWAKLFNNFGHTYRMLGDYQLALAKLQKGLELANRLQDHQTVGAILNNIGLVQIDVDNYPAARQAFEHALRSFSAIRNPVGMAQVHASLGVLHSRINRPDRALTSYLNALDSYKQTGDLSRMARVLRNIAISYLRLGVTDQVLEYYRRALAVSESAGDLETTWRILLNLAVWYRNHNNLPAATLLGKQAVNTIQQMRRHIIGLDRELQQTFLSDKNDVYTFVADLLIEQGRFPEAEQVVAMLKEEELFDFVRRDQGYDFRGTSASYTNDEDKWIARYDRFRADLVRLGKEYAAWELSYSPGEERTERLREVESWLDEAQTAFIEVLSRLDAQFSTENGRNSMAFGNLQLKLLESQQGRLKSLGHGAVLISTVVTPDRLHLLLTTPDIQLARLSPVGAVELNSLIHEFRTALRNPGSNLIPSARALYRHLVLPLEEDLKQAGAETLIWSLDGSLRYVPIAALHDGKRYLIERYPIVVYTAATRGNLSVENGVRWRIAGLGVSKAHPPFSALSEVPRELEAIIKRDAADVDGVIPGSVDLDEAFHADRLKERIREGSNVLHIASHFRLEPGDHRKSFLLLGDGSHLTLEEFQRTRGFKLRNVDLFTLSACNTAMSSNTAGTEIESFGALAQYRGAKSILATLWSVADRSTGQLMRTLYRLRSENNELTKAEALRLAQLSLLYGERIPTNSLERGARPMGKDDDCTSAQRKPCSDNSYSHPYYWAPFILMGNWL